MMRARKILENNFLSGASGENSGGGITIEAGQDA
jgi:hypothetical protein